MCKVVVLLIKPFVFLTFSLPSASLDLKVPIPSLRASVSVRFRRKERGTRVKDRATEMAQVKKLSFHFSRGQKRKSPSSVFLCTEMKRKRLLLKLAHSENALFPFWLLGLPRTVCVFVCKRTI